jgi:type I site-specific restriction endonuclease
MAGRGGESKDSAARSVRPALSTLAATTVERRVKPEKGTRRSIDALLAAAGWTVQDVPAANLHAATGVAIREFPLNTGHGFADYQFYVDGKACGVIEAKKQGATRPRREGTKPAYACVAERVDVSEYPIRVCSCPLWV